MSDKSIFDSSNPAARDLCGNNETGAHWGGATYRGQMLSVAKSICMPCSTRSIHQILVNREDTG